jgi:hypothetical protein
MSNEKNPLTSNLHAETPKKISACLIGICSHLQCHRARESQSGSFDGLDLNQVYHSATPEYPGASAFSEPESVERERYPEDSSPSKSSKSNELKRLKAIEKRAKECLEQKHGDRYGSMWVNTFKFILTGKKEFF